MKKILTFALILVLLFDSYTNAPVSDNPETAATQCTQTLQPSATTELPRLQFLTAEERLELAQVHIPILSEVLYSRDFLGKEAIEYFAVSLLWRDVRELTEVAVISPTDDEGWTLLRITANENEIYYTEVNRQGQNSHLYTAEQWELRNKHMAFFVGKIHQPEFVATVLSVRAIPQIIRIEEIHDFDREREIQEAGCMPESVVVVYLQAEDVYGDVYYLGFCEYGRLQAVTRGCIYGEVIYSSFAGLP
jgi:hypothetical protein